MGRKKKQQQKQPEENTTAGGENQQDLFKTFRYFTRRENWDEFFTTRGGGDYFEWYAEWPQLQSLITTQLLSPSSFLPEIAGEAPPAVQAAELAILVPGCGNSKLSEHLYDAGFTDITNVDFSKVVIADMLRRNVRERPTMKWRVMDMARIEFGDKTLDAIVDKGGLDALMVPDPGYELGRLYLSEVKRLLKDGGKYICLTLAESRVSALLFSMFRFGWKTSLYTIPKESSSKNLEPQTFMVVVEKDTCASVYEISAVDKYSVESHGNQARELYEALEREQKVRSECSSGSNKLYSIKELSLGAKGNLKEFEPDRMIKLILGEPGVFHFYIGVLVDAQQDSGSNFSDYFAVYLVPNILVDVWLFSSEEGQKIILADSDTARLLIIFLNYSNSGASMDYIQSDLTPLVKQLAPRLCDDTYEIPFMTSSEGIDQRVVVHEVTSALTGTIVVEDVTYHDRDENRELEDMVFRRLSFHRSPSVVQSEALLTEVQTPSKTMNKGKQKKSGSKSHKASSNERKVDHNVLARMNNNALITGLMLISTHLKGFSCTRPMVETVVIGLGAGMLAMFMKNWIPNLNIEVIEIDQVVVDVAKEHFGFKEDERLRVRIADGIEFVREKADCEAARKLDILIVDADSPYKSSPLSCPSEDFVEESFLQNSKNSLSEEGLFVINVVSRSSPTKVAVRSSLKKVFGKGVLYLQLDDDDDEVMFALKNDSPITEDDLSKACDKLERSLELVNHNWTQSVITASKSIRPLR
ncbi:hypothetical protein ABFX02_09G042000 [Erythranthe guttata]